MVLVVEEFQPMRYRIVVKVIVLGITALILMSDVLSGVRMVIIECRVVHHQVIMNVER